jgi:transposase
VGCADKALGRSRGGLGTRVQLLADEAGLPIACRITPGRLSNMPQAASLLEGQHAESLIADTGCDSTDVVATIQALGAITVMPPRCHWSQPKSCDRALYKQRNLIEPRLKQFRRFCTRYCRTIETLRSCTALACAWLRLQLYGIRLALSLLFY